MSQELPSSVKTENNSLRFVVSIGLGIFFNLLALNGLSMSIERIRESGMIVPQEFCVIIPTFLAGLVMMFISVRALRIKTR